MDALVTVLVVLVVGAVVAWWLMRRRRTAPVEDEWTLPPEAPGQESANPSGGAAPAPVQRLDRDALVNPNRTLDPSKWDNSPDGGGEVEGDLPRFFDRDYLARKDGAPEAAASTEDAPDDPDGSRE